MLIELHAHVPHPDFLNKHPHWGPTYVTTEDGDIQLKIGKWQLSLGIPERKAALKAGNVEPLEATFAKRRDPSVRIAQMDAMGQDVQVLSLPAHYAMYWADPEFSVSYASHVNDVLAAYCAPYSDRLFFWAHAPVNQPEAAAKEVERAVLQLGAKGLSMGGANFGGLEFGDEALYPLWAKLCDLDVPIFVHGFNQSVTWGDKADTERFEVTSICGMIYDESQCFWNLICGGVLDRFPNLKVYITHGGGFVPYQLGRMEMTNRVLGDTLNKKPLRDYLPQFYFDPLVHSMAMRRAVIEDISIDRLLYGSNFGGSDGIREDLTEGLGLSEEDRNKIRSENARKLLRFGKLGVANKSDHKVMQTSL